MLEIILLKTAVLEYLPLDASTCFSSSFFNANASLSSGKDLKYSAKESSFTDKGELVAVSLDMLFTIHAEYPRPFSKSHLKVLPLNLPN